MDILKKIKTLIESRNKTVAIQHIISEKKEFENNVALITGGTGGIGLAIGKVLLECGCKVIIAGTNDKKIKNTILSFSNSDDVKGMVFDYSKIDKFDTYITEAISQFGKINIFISSAGVHTTNVDFWSMTPSEYDRVMEINLKGTYFACKAIGKYMIDNDIQGKILVISSSRGSEPAWSPYGLSKWGIRGLIQGLAAILQPYSINVNAIAPGSTATKLIGVEEGDSVFSNENGEKRLVIPDEVATLAKLLVGESGRMITGETIHISAGRGIFDIR